MTSKLHAIYGQDDEASLAAASDSSDASGWIAEAAIFLTEDTSNL